MAVSHRENQSCVQGITLKSFLADICNACVKFGYFIYMRYSSKYYKHCSTLNDGNCTLLCALPEMLCYIKYVCIIKY